MIAKALAANVAGFIFGVRPVRARKPAAKARREHASAEQTRETAKTAPMLWAEAHHGERHDLVVLMDGSAIVIESNAAAPACRLPDGLSARIAEDIRRLGADPVIAAS